MKKQLLFFIIILASKLSLFAQETTVNLSLENGYSKQVYYKLSTETETKFDANSWDIAFLRTNAFAHAIRINDGLGTQVFEAANSASAWNTINIADEASWTELRNSDTDWDNGAFMQGTAANGWGAYNPANHHIIGSIIYVLKYTDGTYYKFINEDYFGAYTFKYAKWDAINNVWEADQTATVSNTSNPDNTYNYYSLQNNQEVVAEPASADWDFVFRKYYTELPSGDFYNVTGVLQSSNITVAQNDESSSNDTSGLSYSDEINIIGSDWKEFNMGTFSYDVDENQIFYVKDETSKIYRMYFTSFAGSSTGNVSFNFEDVTATLSNESIDETVQFGMYPNPSTNKRVSLLFDTSATSKINIAVYNINGTEVLTKHIDINAGFYNKELDLSNLSTGVYVVRCATDKGSTTKKLVLK